MHRPFASAIPHLGFDSMDVFAHGQNDKGILDRHEKNEETPY